MYNLVKKSSSATSSAVPHFKNNKMRNLVINPVFTGFLKFRTQVPHCPLQVPHFDFYKSSLTLKNTGFVEVPHWSKICSKKIQVPQSINPVFIWLKLTFLSSVVVTPHITYGGKKPP